MGIGLAVVTHSVGAQAGKWQISTSGGMSPPWARDGHTLFFVNDAREMMAVPTGSAPPFGQPRTLFGLSEDYYGVDPQSPDFYTPFDVGLDGRFVMAKRVRQGESSEPLILIENWFRELRRKTAR